jgi:solute carrier family 25 (mitochondrial carnitine/acylcarnitine transporter), member 20/29
VMDGASHDRTIGRQSAASGRGAGALEIQNFLNKSSDGTPARPEHHVSKARNRISKTSRTFPIRRRAQAACTSFSTIIARTTNPSTDCHFNGTQTSPSNTMSPALMDSSCPVSHFLFVQQQWMDPRNAPSSRSTAAAERSIGGATSSSSSPADARHPSADARQFGAAPLASHVNVCPNTPSLAAFTVPSSSGRASSSALWDAVPGAVGGFCSVLVGHPLDLLKVRMQAGPSASHLSSSSGGGGGTPSLHNHRHHSNGRQMTTSAARPWLGHRPMPAAFQRNRSMLSLSTQTTSRTGRRIGHLGVWNTGASQAIRWGLAAPAERSGGVGTLSALGGAVSRAPAVMSSASAMPPTAGLRGMAMDVVRQNGIRGLYAGMTAPLVAVVPAFGVTIWSFEAAKRQLLLLRPEHHRQQQHGFDPASMSHQQQQLTVSEAAAAGAASGVFAAFVLGPLERIKCEFQLHPHRYRSFLDCVRVQIARGGGGGPQPMSMPPRLSSWSLSNPYSTHQPGLSFPAVGQVRELFRGTFLTVCRDVPGNAMYFAVYESVRRAILSSTWRRHNETDDASSSSRRRLAATALAGGIAGVANWCLCLPVDAVKTRWQTAPAGAYSSPLHVFRDMLREGGNQHAGSQQGRSAGGIAALYRGLGPAVLRAFPANAVALCAVDLTRQVLGMPTL